MVAHALAPLAVAVEGRVEERVERVEETMTAGEAQA